MHSHIDISKAPARQQHISINISPSSFGLGMLRRVVRGLYGARKLLWQGKNVICVCACVWLEFGLSSLGFTVCVWRVLRFYHPVHMALWLSLACCWLLVTGYWLPTSCRSILIVFCTFKRSTIWGEGRAVYTQLSD